jgi:exodeoxyribonuclease-3
MSYNIRLGGLGRESAIASVIREAAPDVVILQEATRPDVVAGLAASTGLGHWAAVRGRSLAFLSRLPVERYEWTRSWWSRHAILEVAPSGLDVRVVGVHLSALHAEWSEERRRLELRALLSAIRRHEPGFHVVAGDFNTLAPGEPFDPRRLPRRLRPFVWVSGGRIRWRALNAILEAGYIDAFRLRNDPRLAEPTFPTSDPHLRLDYVFLPSAFADRVEACDVVREPAETVAASDHFPIAATLAVTEIG